MKINYTLKPIQQNCYAFIKLFFVFIFCFAGSVKAQPQLSFTPFIQNFTNPLLVTNAGDGSGRLFIVEQSGVIKIYKNGVVLPKPFLDLSNIIPHINDEGMYNLVFAPDYKNNKTFFVFYYAKGGLTKLARYKTSKTNPDSAIASSGVVLLSLSGNNSGGAHVGDMHFGKDGYLYISINDGSIYDNTTAFAQDGQSMLGKILRLNVVNVNTPPYYTIPPDNPYVNDPDVLDEIWALGLRNAWRWSFDKRNGNMWLADVGGDHWEEVDFRTPSQSAGTNYGWPCYEGDSTFITTGCKSSSNYSFPVFEYAHNNDTSAEVITGGYVYNGTAYPALKGYYVCADYTKGNAWLIKSKRSGGWNVFKETGFPLGLVSFGEDENSELYAASLSTGIIYKVGTSPSVEITKPKMSLPISTSTY